VSGVVDALPLDERTQCQRSMHATNNVHCWLAQHKDQKIETHVKLPRLRNGKACAFHQLAASPKHGPEQERLMGIPQRHFATQYSLNNRKWFHRQAFEQMVVRSSICRSESSTVFDATNHSGSEQRNLCSSQHNGQHSTIVFLTQIFTERSKPIASTLFFFLSDERHFFSLFWFFLVDLNHVSDGKLCGELIRHSINKRSSSKHASRKNVAQIGMIKRPRQKLKTKEKQGRNRTTQQENSHLNSHSCNRPSPQLWKKRSTHLLN
jgi:hypothetical protein